MNNIADSILDFIAGNYNNTRVHIEDISPDLKRYALLFSVIYEDTDKHLKPLNLGIHLTYTQVAELVDILEGFLEKYKDL